MQCGDGRRRIWYVEHFSCSRITNMLICINPRWPPDLTKVSCNVPGVVQLAVALAEETEDHIQAAAAWALGQIGRHTPEHAKAVAQANVLPKLLQCYLRADAAEDLQTKVVPCSFSLCTTDTF